MSAIGMQAAQDTFQDTVDILKGLVSKFTRSTGGNWDDNFSIAQSAWWYAYKKHDPKTGGFIPWMKFVVWRQMQEQQRRDCMRNARIRRNRGVEMEFVAQEEAPTWDKEQFMASLSEDARVVVTMVLDSSKDLDIAVLERGGVSPVNIRKALREVCKDIGWSLQRLRAACSEIKGGH